jgi:hypothetical protein
MMLRPTPETEASLLRGVCFNTLDAGVVLADFARKLERERDEARAQYETTYLLAEALAKTQVELKAERDEARCELEMWRDGNILHEMHRDELAKVERERDEAREAAAYFERLKDIYKRLAKSPDREAARVSPPRAAAENASCGHLGAENL